MKPVVVSLHGIRTRGRWQKELATVLALADLIPCSLDYGYLTIVGFAVPWVRKKKLTWFKKEYDAIRAEQNVERPSVVAHSFGTYLVAELLATYNDVLFDKVILCGSIVDSGYDWGRYLANGRVKFVRNDYGSIDIWPKLSSRLVRNSGPSGQTGFDCTHPLFIQCKHEKFGHSDYFNRGQFEKNWIPLLHIEVSGSCAITSESRKEIRRIIDLLRQACARNLDVSWRNVRVNTLLAQEKNGGIVLGYSDGLWSGEVSSVERTLTVPFGIGASGKAFERNEMTIAQLGLSGNRRHWGEHDLPTEDLVKVDPDLTVIISQAIRDLRDETRPPTAVLNVDLLDVPYDIDRITPILPDIEASAEAIENCLLATATAFFDAIASGTNVDEIS